MKQKALSLLLALCMALMLFPLSAQAAETAGSAAEAPLPFTDVPQGFWCYDAVEYVYTNHLFQGSTATTFSPAATMTRGMIVTVLYRLAGSPAVSTEKTFTDVTADTWCRDAALWAAETTVSSGYADGSFGVNTPITRQQLVSMLYAYVNVEGLGRGRRSGSYAAYSDAAKVASYAGDAMAWAIGNEILSGVSDQILAPDGTASRAQVATILYRLITGDSTKYEENSTLLQASDGTLIPATVTVPVAASSTNQVPGIVMLHGTGSTRDEAGNGYKVAAPILSAQYGLATIRIDFRGNGDSTAAYTDYNFKTAVSDAVDAAKYLQSMNEVNNGKIGVMGWSQGGTDALLAAGEHPDIFKCVVTWAGAPDLRDMLSDANYATAKTEGSFTMDFDWRSSLQVGFQWCEDVRNTDVLKVFKTGYTGPVLAIAGRKDTTVDPEWSNKIVAASANSASKTHFIDDMDHTFNVFSEADLHSLREAVNATGFFFQDNLD